MTTLNFSKDNIKELTIASEGMSHVIEKTYNGLLDKTKKISDYLSDLLPTVKAVIEDSSKKLELETIPELNKDQKVFLEVANKYPFQEMRELKAWKPEGSNCTYLEFTNELVSQIDRANNIKKVIIDPYMVFLAKLVSRDNSINSTNSNKALFFNLETSRNKAYDSISKLYKEDSVESITTVGKVIDRNNDWVEVLQKVNLITDKVNQIKIKDIQSDISICNNYLSDIMDDIKKEDTLNISPETIKQLADYTYQVAKEVEFFSVTYFRVLTIKGSVENTMEQVIKVKG